MIDRRSLLATGGILAVGTAVVACSSQDGSQDSTNAAPASPDSQSEVASNVLNASDIPVGGGVIVAESAVVVVQPEAGTFAAYTAVCPHQGCLVSEVVENEIRCPCHGSAFSAADGSVIQGPALQGLTQAAISVDGTTITAG
jgi:Rieske Fe-S protein